MKILRIFFFFFGGGGGGGSLQSLTTSFRGYFYVFYGLFLREMYLMGIFIIFFFLGGGGGNFKYILGCLIFLIFWG